MIAVSCVRHNSLLPTQTNGEEPPQRPRGAAGSAVACVEARRSNATTWSGSLQPVSTASDIMTIARRREVAIGQDYRTFTAVTWRQLMTKNRLRKRAYSTHSSSAVENSLAAAAAASAGRRAALGPAASLTGYRRARGHGDQPCKRRHVHCSKALESRTLPNIGHGHT